MEHESSQIRAKYLHMTVNVLIGYVTVELIAVLARLLDLTSMSLADLFMLAAAANCVTIGFIILLYLKRRFTVLEGRIIFAAELLSYLVIYSITVYRMDELRIIALAFAFLAVTIELPFTSPAESLWISLGSLGAYLAASYCGIELAGQNGSFRTEVFYALSFLPPMLLIFYVAGQIHTQRMEIERDRSLLVRLNEEISHVNRELTKSQERSKKEMELAAYVQSSLFPAEPPTAAGWDVAFVFRPAGGVSGDFYDFYYEGNRLKGIALFDVSGHGVASGLVTMLVKPIVYRLFTQMEGESLGAIAARANEIISHEIESIDNYITGVLVRFAEGQVEYVNIGHPDLLLRRREQSRVRIVAPAGREYKGMPFGKHFAEASYKTLRFPVLKGDVIAMTTDGLLEGFNDKSLKYGLARLSLSLEEAPEGTAREMLDFILSKFYAFVGKNTLHDDFVLMLAKKTS